MTKGVAVAPDRPVGTAMPFSRHLTRTARLAGPVILARAGLLVMVAIDSAMLGHYGTLSLAYYAAANAAQVVMILIGVGLLQGTTILVAQAHGAHGPRRLRHVLAREHGPTRPLLGVVMGLLCLLGRWILEGTGQQPEVAAGGGRVLDMIAWGSPPLLMWVVCSHFLEGISRPIPGMLLMFGAVLLKRATQLDPHLRQTGAGRRWERKAPGHRDLARALGDVRGAPARRAAPVRCPGARHQPAGFGFLGGLEAAQAHRLSAGRRTGARDRGVRGPGDVRRPPRPRCRLPPIRSATT